jgi:preprotein translocase subunit SecG
MTVQGKEVDMGEFFKTKSNVVILILVVIIIALTTIVIMQECKMRRFDTRRMRDGRSFTTQMQGGINGKLQNKLGR